jgi:D-3-phosphoglycerate dehydrogenase
MAVSQLKNYLEKGNIRNSVNFPECEMAFSAQSRILVANRNVPNMVGQITAVLAEKKINIADMINKHKNDVAYNIIDIDGSIGDDETKAIGGIEGVIMARVITAG